MSDLIVPGRGESLPGDGFEQTTRRVGLFRKSVEKEVVAARLISAAALALNMRYGWCEVLICGASFRCGDRSMSAGNISY